MIATFKSKAIFKDAILLTFFFSFFYILWMGSYPLFIPDEGRYSEVAREMIATGNYITPHLNGVAFLDKPILYYWLQASAIKMFDLTEWSLRFWPVVIGILGALITYVSGHLLFGRRSALLATLILALNPLYYGASHYANLDLEVAVFISSALLFFIVGMDTKQQKHTRTIFLLMFYVFAAFATLTKGLIGIIFPMMIIGSWILILNRFRILTKMHLFWGILIFCAITLPWFLLVQRENPQFFDFFFMKQQFSRFLANEEFNNKSHAFFYIPLILAGIIPWSIFLFQSIKENIKNVWKHRQNHAAELFLLLWIFLITLFYSIPKSKTPGYILPVLPAIALIIGRYLSNHWDQKAMHGIRYGMVSFILLCFILSIFCLVAPRILPVSHLNFYLILTSILLMISGLSGYILLRQKKAVKWLFYCLSLTIAIFLLIIINSAKDLNYKSTKPLTNLIIHEIKPTDEIVTYYRFYQDLPIYLKRRITIVADWHAANISQYDNWRRELWYNMSYQNTSEWLIEDPEFLQRFVSDKRMFVFMSERFYSGFLNKLHAYDKNTVVYLLSQDQVVNKFSREKTILISNKPLQS